jgi:hypothetical protein
MTQIFFILFDDVQANSVRRANDEHDFSLPFADVAVLSDAISLKLALDSKAKNVCSDRKIYYYRYTSILDRSIHLMSKQGQRAEIYGLSHHGHTLSSSSSLTATLR